MLHCIYLVYVCVLSCLITMKWLIDWLQCCLAYIPGVGERHSSNNHQQQQLNATWTHFLCKTQRQKRSSLLLRFLVRFNSKTTGNYRVHVFPPPSYDIIVISPADCLLYGENGFSFWNWISVIPLIGHGLVLFISLQVTAYSGPTKSRPDAARSCPDAVRIGRDSSPYARPSRYHQQLQVLVSLPLDMSAGVKF